jgi:hypothetical protein
MGTPVLDSLRPLDLKRVCPNEAFDGLVKRVFMTVESTLAVKGGEYAGDNDRLANFRRNALALGIPAETVWAVYAGKHWDSLMQYINDISTKTNRHRAEPMTGRIVDLIAYLMLFYAMEEEKATIGWLPNASYANDTKRI